METPEDIQRAARAAHDETLVSIVPSFAENDVLVAIARAILAERERCAKIAEEYGGGDYWGKSKPIASAIRTPSTGEET